MSEPLMITYSADAPYDETVLLVNVLQKQCEVSDKRKQEVLAACKFILSLHKEKGTE